MRVRATLLGFVAVACVRPHEDARSKAESTAPSEPATLRPEAAPGPLDASVQAPDLPNVATDWCEPDWRALDETTCYFVPPGSKRLLIYLSGIVPPISKSAQKEKVQRVVMAAAKRAGVAALLPRGRRGIGPADARDWWAWPTQASDYARHSASLVAEWEAARAKLEASVGAFERVYLAGSSSGAYFLTALALRGDIELDGYAAASGGAPVAAKVGVKKRPFYIGYATGDSANGGPKALAAYLNSAGWPVRVSEHPGGHGAREVYLDEAFALWSAVP